MDPDPWESSAASCLVLLAYCLFQMLWGKFNVLLLCIAVTMTHLASLYLTVMVGFFYFLWNRRLQAGRHLIRFLALKFPVEQLVPTYQALSDALSLGRTWSLGILCLVLNSARRNAQRLLNQLRNELGKALYHAARWTHCGLAIVCQNAYQVMRDVILQLHSTLFWGCSERLWTAISQGIENARAFWFLEHSTQQHPGCRSMKEMNEVPACACCGSCACLKQRLQRPDWSSLRGHCSTDHIPAPPASTELDNCHFLTPGVPLNTRFHDSKKKMEKKTKKNEDEKEKNVEKKEKEKKEKKEEEKVEKEKGGKKEVKEEEREKEKIEKEETKEEIKEEVKAEDKTTKRKAKKKTEFKEEEKVEKEEEEKGRKVGKMKEKSGGKRKKVEEEEEEAEDKDKAEKKEERKTSVA